MESVEAEVTSDADFSYKPKKKRAVRKKSSRYYDIMAEAISPTPPTIDDAAKTNLTTQLSEYALVGLRVRVCAPQNMFHLKEGIVVSYESAAELYVVHLDHCKEELMIKGLAFFYKY